MGLGEYQRRSTFDNYYDSWGSPITGGTVRDAERIDRMLALVRQVWINTPDLRLGQLIYGAMSFGGARREDGLPFDIFLIEDDVTERGLNMLADVADEA